MHPDLPLLNLSTDSTPRVGHARLAVAARAWRNARPPTEA